MTLETISQLLRHKHMAKPIIVRGQPCHGGIFCGASAFGKWFIEEAKRLHTAVWCRYDMLMRRPRMVWRPLDYLICAACVTQDTLCAVWPFILLGLAYWCVRDRLPPRDGAAIMCLAAQTSASIN